MIQPGVLPHHASSPRCSTGRTPAPGVGLCLRSSVERAPGSGPGGRRFESCRGHAAGGSATLNCEFGVQSPVTVLGVPGGRQCAALRCRHSCEGGGFASVVQRIGHRLSKPGGAGSSPVGGAQRGTSLTGRAGACVLLVGRAFVAQWRERLFPKQEATGSSPVGGTTSAQFGRQQCAVGLLGHAR